MAENVLDSLGMRLADLKSEKKKIEEELEKIEMLIIGYMNKNGVDKAKTQNFSFSLNTEGFSLEYIDRDLAMEYLKKNGLWDRFQKPAFDSPGLKKYCKETGDTLGDTVELGKETKLTVSPTSK